MSFQYSTKYTVMSVLFKCLLPVITSNVLTACNSLCHEAAKFPVMFSVTVWTHVQQLAHKDEALSSTIFSRLLWWYEISIVFLEEMCSYLLFCFSFLSFLFFLHSCLWFAFKDFFMNQNSLCVEIRAKLHLWEWSEYWQSIMSSLNIMIPWDKWNKIKIIIL